MKHWTARLAFLVVLASGRRAQAQSKLTVEQLISFVKSSVQLHHDDRQIATFIKKNVKLSNRLDARTVEELQGAGAGPANRGRAEGVDHRIGQPGTATAAGSEAGGGGTAAAGFHRAKANSRRDHGARPELHRGLAELYLPPGDAPLRGCQRPRKLPPDRHHRRASQLQRAEGRLQSSFDQRHSGDGERQARAEERRQFLG